MRLFQGNMLSSNSILFKNIIELNKRVGEDKVVDEGLVVVRMGNKRK